MTISSIDESQRTAARVAGFTCLFTMATVVFAHYGISAHLIVAGNAAETARNIMAHERLFRISIACDLIYGAAVLAPVATSLADLAPEGLPKKPMELTRLPLDQSPTSAPS